MGDTRSLKDVLNKIKGMMCSTQDSFLALCIHSQMTSHSHCIHEIFAN